jgi:hypothetical protein
MIADNVAKMVIEKKHELITKKNLYADPPLAIYMENRRWYDMMAELRGRMSPAAYDIFQSMGKTIFGCLIHRVLTEGHGIKVYEA